MFKYSNGWGWKAKVNEGYIMGAENTDKFKKDNLNSNFRMLFLPRVQRFACLCSGLVITCHTHAATQPILQTHEGWREELQEILLQGKQLRVLYGWYKDTWQHLQGYPNQGKNAVMIMLTQLQPGEASNTNDIFIIFPINALADNKKTFYLIPFAGHKFSKFCFLLSSLLISDLGGKGFGRV